MLPEVGDAQGEEAEVASDDPTVGPSFASTAINHSVEIPLEDHMNWSIFTGKSIIAYTQDVMGSLKKLEIENSIF